MPSLGADMEAGTLVEWMIKPGDRVKRGDIVAVVETHGRRLSSSRRRTGLGCERLRHWFRQHQYFGFPTAGGFGSASPQQVGSASSREIRP
jgi:hypothetical protein